MRATFRHLDAEEADPELLALGASAGAAVWGGAWVLSGLPLPRCAFHAITGCPCPTCGATRCVLALFHGHIGDAMSWSPLALMASGGIFLLVCYAAVVLAAGLPRLRLSLTGMEARMVRMAFVVLLAANWAYEIHHGV